VKKFSLLISTTALSSLVGLVSCSSIKDPEETSEALENEQPIAQTEEPKPQELPAPLTTAQVTPVKKKKTPIFVDPPTHEELMTEKDKKTVFEIPRSNLELPKQPDEQGISATPPVIPPPPLKSTASTGG